MLADFLLLVINDTVLIGVVMSNICLIRLHDKIILPTLGILLIASIGGTGFLLIIYIKFGEINLNSLRVLKFWRSNSLFLVPLTPDRTLLKKYLKSCNQLKLRIGPFGVFRKTNAIRIMHKLIFYTVKALVLIKGIS